ncbi:hypothetical protein ABPG73_004502 [Tetrahymena malaccensis]
MTEQNKIFLNVEDFINFDPSSLSYLELKLWKKNLFAESNRTEECVELQNQLRLCSEIRALILDLEHLTVDEQQFKLLFDDLPGFKNLEILQINLKYSKIRSSAHYLAKFLLKCQKLTKLQLYLLNNQLDSKMASEIIKSIGTINTTQHLEIELKGNFIKVDALESLKNTLTGLQGKLFIFKIGLREINVNEELIQKVIECLNACSQVTELLFDLSKNQLVDQQIQIISEPFSQFKNLRVLLLDFEENNITSLGASSIGKIFSNFTQISSLELNLRENWIEDQGIIDIVKGLNQCINLIHVGLFFKLPVLMSLTIFAFKLQQIIKSIVIPGFNDISL